MTNSLPPLNPHFIRVKITSGLWTKITSGLWTKMTTVMNCPALWKLVEVSVKNSKAISRTSEPIGASHTGESYPKQRAVSVRAEQRMDPTRRRRQRPAGTNWRGNARKSYICAFRAPCDGWGETSGRPSLVVPCPYKCHGYLKQSGTLIVRSHLFCGGKVFVFLKRLKWRISRM